MNSPIKTLVIHPEDRSTAFLKAIYEHIPNKTVVTKGDRVEVMDMTKDHQRVLMMGHGSSIGLFSAGQFKNTSHYVVDRHWELFLRGKTNVFIWCNADRFVETYNLKGFYSGMFVSEVGEARFCGLDKFSASQDQITESNNGFSQILSEVIESPVNEMHRHVVERYGVIAEQNRVAEYNLDRIYIN